MDSPEYTAFMAHIPKSEWKAVVKHITTKYPDRKYLIAGEHKPYEHLHYLIEMTPTEYKKYADSIFARKYKLRGKAVKDKARQYGKIKEIRDVERLQAYMVKEGLEYNVNIFTNINKDKLKLLKDTISHKKLDRAPYKRFINYLKNTYETHKEYITMKELLSIWLKTAQTRLPTMKTVMYYAYQSEIITEDTYVEHHISNHIEHFPISCDWRLGRG